MLEECSAANLARYSRANSSYSSSAPNDRRTTLVKGKGTKDRARAVERKRVQLCSLKLGGDFRNRSSRNKCARECGRNSLRISAEQGISTSLTVPRNSLAKRMGVRLGSVCLAEELCEPFGRWLAMRCIMLGELGYPDTCAAIFFRYIVRRDGNRHHRCSFGRFSVQACILR